MTGVSAVGGTKGFLNAVRVIRSPRSHERANKTHQQVLASGVRLGVDSVEFGAVL